jgi:hypothetical protein
MDDIRIVNSNLDISLTILDKWGIEYEKS